MKHATPKRVALAMVALTLVAAGYLAGWLFPPQAATESHIADHPAVTATKNPADDKSVSNTPATPAKPSATPKPTAKSSIAPKPSDAANTSPCPKDLPLGRSTLFFDLAADGYTTWTLTSNDHQDCTIGDSWHLNVLRPLLVHAGSRTYLDVIVDPNACVHATWGKIDQIDMSTTDPKTKAHPGTDDLPKVINTTNHLKAGPTVNDGLIYITVDFTTADTDPICEP